MFSHKKKVFFFILIALAAILLVSCNLLSSLFQNNSEPNFDEIMLTNTQLAISMRETAFAAPQVQVFVTQTYLAQNIPTNTLSPTRTATPTIPLAPSVTAKGATNTPVLAATYTNTSSPTPTQGPSLTPTPVPPTSTPRVSDAMEARIRNARVLILEDIACDPTLIPRLHTVVENMGMNPENVFNYNCATGTFIEHLEAGEDWDLIIVATEQRTEARFGPIWEMLYEYAQDGTAIIVEAWYLEEIGAGSIQPLLEQCGVRIHADWHRKESDEAYSYVVYDIADNNHRLFNRPKHVEVPLIPRFYWADDVGDLVEILPVSNAAIIGGLHVGNSLQYGLITECMDRRMVLQTFSTHNYKKTDTLNLWENYIYNTLLSHFEYLDSQTSE